MRPPRSVDTPRNSPGEITPVGAEFSPLPVVRPVPARALIAGIATAIALLAVVAFKAQHTHYEEAAVLLSRPAREDGAAAVAELAVRLELPAAAIASVQPGSTLEVFLDAYPSPRFPPVQVAVDVVGVEMVAAELDSPEATPRRPLASRAASTGRVLVAQGRVVDDAALKLVPGMLGRARIATEQRSVLSWLLLSGGGL